MSSNESSMENLAKAQAAWRPPRPWRSSQESQMIRRFVFWWFTCRDPISRDVFGMTGQAILGALLEGTATPEQMAQLARGLAKRKIPQLVEALKGHRLTESHRFLIVCNTWPSWSN
jgi:hypothetical protein